MSVLQVQVGRQSVTVQVQSSGVAYATQLIRDQFSGVAEAVQAAQEAAESAAEAVATVDGKADVTDPRIVKAPYGVATITALRVLAGGFEQTSVFVMDPLRGGMFAYDATDTTTADDGGCVIVDAASRRWKRIFSGSISPEWFGAKGDGTTDDTTTLNLALASPSALKHEVVGGGVYRITSGHLIIPEAVTFRLNSAFGEDATGYTPWDRPCIRTSSAYEVRVYNGATFDAAMFRYGLTKAASYAAAMTNIAAFAGVGIRIMGEDTTVRAFVVGYATAYSSAGRESCDLYLEHDCTNGAYIYGSLDEGEVTVRGTPYYTVHQFTEHDVTRRQGVNCWIESCDGIRVKDVYDYGWDVGLRLTACSAGTVIEKVQSEVFLDVVCSNIGVLTEGLMTNVKVLSIHSDGHHQNVVFNHSGTIQVGIMDVSAARSAHLFIATYAGVQATSLACANASPNMVQFDTGTRTNVFSLDQLLFHRGAPAQNALIYDPAQAALGKIIIGTITQGDDSSIIDNWTNAARTRTLEHADRVADRAGPAVLPSYSGDQSFIQAVDERSHFGTVSLTMDSRGTYSGAGNLFLRHVSANVPAGPAYTLTPTCIPGPGYGSPGYSGAGAVLGGGHLQNTLMAGRVTTGTQGRESELFPDRGDGFPSITFNDLVFDLTTGSMNASAGRLWMRQDNGTIRAGFDGQLIIHEKELFNESGASTTYTGANQKIIDHAVSVGGVVDKGYAFAARDGGRYKSMIYTDPSFVIDSFMRIEGVFSIKHQTLDQVILSWGTMTPRDASDLIYQAVKPSQVYTMRQIADITDDGQIFDIYQSIDPTQEYSISVGLHTDSAEFRFARGEGLNIGVDYPDSDIMVAFAQDRWGFGGSPQVEGGENLLYLKNGAAPTAGAPGIADGGALVVIDGALWFKGGLGTFTKLANA